MKYIAAIILTVIAGSSMSQTSGLLWRYDKQVEDCGTWVKDSMRYTDWVTVDTLSGEAAKKEISITKPEQRDWVYDKERSVTEPNTDLVFYFCGREPGEKWRQYRICRITGIKQERYRIQSYKYIPPPKSAYQQAEDSLLNKAGRRFHIGTLSIDKEPEMWWIGPANSGTTLEYKLHN